MKTNYISPVVETVNIDIEDAILAGSEVSVNGSSINDWTGTSDESTSLDVLKK